MAGRTKNRIDKPLASLIAILIISGALIFASAAFGLLARGSSMSSVFFSHLVLGLGLGSVLLVALTYIDYRVWKPYTPYIFALSILATAAVFVPHIGMSHGGGRRWIVLMNMSFQPSEAMKVGAILFAATYFSVYKNKIGTLLYGLGGFFGILAVPAAILILQPDIGTLSIICFSVGAMFLAAGASVRDLLLVLVIGILGLGLLATMKPYIRDRVETFLNPAQGQQGQSYQIKQSLIAVGSGGFTGRGFGQGIQKFTYLPEPMGDSIFAVAAEELGFLGAGFLILLYLSFALRGYTVSARAPDMFGALLGIGICTYLVVEAFINIAAMLGVAPLTGIPLTFISQGGSAMLVSLAAAGLLLSISRFKSARTSA
ncbi:FtsW/RodA/SpoVE family cell cycle protein [Candidatus Kaiserbacteria bacterium]|nr:FtsW/RodA/SpoVE family cell cycle protein [Candidatus Kaiserbacteria bacterium]